MLSHHEHERHMAGAADFYCTHGFVPVVDDPLKLFLPMPLSSG